MPKVLTMASHRKDWNKISAESSLESQGILTVLVHFSPMWRIRIVLRFGRILHGGAFEHMNLVAQKYCFLGHI